MADEISKNVLVIDDEFAVRRSFELALEDTDYLLKTVDCGEDGVKAATENDFQLIFLDLKMPGMNGVQTLRGIRSVKPNVPVYIVTAFHKEFLTELDDARKQGLQFQLLRKPIGSVEIQTLTQSVIDKPVRF
jgi:CheY-like chemotaxis protein